MGILKKLGIRVRYFGFKGVQKRLFPVDIQQVDAVITIGKTVQYAIKVGVPVYCYDHFGGPGWINSENFERAEMFNFSGRCCNLKKTPMVISDEIISGHRKAACDIMTIRDNIKEKYSLEKFITRIIDPPKKIIFSDGELDLIKERVAVEAAQGSIVRRLYRAHENLSIKQKKRRIFRRLFRKIFLFSKIRE